MSPFMPIMSLPGSIVLIEAAGAACETSVALTTGAAGAAGAAGTGLQPASMIAVISTQDRTVETYNLFITNSP